MAGVVLEIGKLWVEQSGEKIRSSWEFKMFFRCLSGDSKRDRSSW